MIVRPRKVRNSVCMREKCACYCSILQMLVIQLSTINYGYTQEHEPRPHEMIPIPPVMGEPELNSPSIPGV